MAESIICDLVKRRALYLNVQNLNKINFNTINKKFKIFGGRGGDYSLKMKF